MEALGPYWLRRILLHLPEVQVYEGLDARTGTPVLLLRGRLEGEVLAWPGGVPLLEQLPEAWVLEWPLGAVPLERYLGVADPERLLAWTKGLLEGLAHLEAQGVRYAPRAPLVLVKGRRVWLVGAGLKALEGEAGPALLELVRELAGEAWEAFPLRPALEALARGEVGFREALRPPGEALGEAGPAEVETPVVQASPPAQPGPASPEPPEEARPLAEPPAKPPIRKPLPVEENPTGPSPVPESPAPEAPRRRVIRLEDAEDRPPFEPVEPLRRGVRWGLFLGVFLLVLGVLGAFFWLRSRPDPEGPYLMEFRTDPPTERAEVYLLEAPEGSRLLPGALLLTAPGRAEFDQPGVYRLRIRAPGRDPVDYLLEVPGPSLVIRLR